MKRILILVALIATASFSFAQEIIELEEGKYFEFPNPLYELDKRLYRDNIRFINDTYDNIEFEAYGKPVNNEEIKFLVYKACKGDDSNVCNAPLSIKCYEKIYIKILNGKVEQFFVEPSHNDLYFTVKIHSNEYKSKIFIFICNKKQKSLYQFKDLGDREIPRAEIKVEDKEFGVISGRGTDTFSFSFKIQTTSESVSIDFYDFYDPSIHVVGHTMKSYNAQKRYSEALAKNLEIYLNDNQ